MSSGAGHLTPAAGSWRPASSAPLSNARVALVGNMNNNHFALLRYLRDLGVNATLLMFSNEAAHFYPQQDTWQ